MSMLETWLSEYVVAKVAAKFRLTDDETVRVQAAVDNLVYVAEQVLQREYHDTQPPPQQKQP
jgi:hypothetical protein